MSTFCAICSKRHATVHTPCTCEVWTCTECVPTRVPAPEGLVDAFGNCTSNGCAYQAYAESLMCKVCTTEPGAYRLPCECGLLVCEGCIPETIPADEEITEAFGPCTNEHCSSVAYFQEELIIRALDQPSVREQTMINESSRPELVQE